MLDIQLFRADKGGEPDLIRQSQEKRFADVSLVDKVIELDEAWRKAEFDASEASKEKRLLSKEIGSYKKKKEEPPEELMQKVAEVDAKMVELKEVSKDLLAERLKYQGQIGNLVADDVPVSNNEEEDSVTVATWGEELIESRGEQKFDHHHIMQMMEMYDGNRGANLVGHRGYFLTGPGLLLNQALISFGLSTLVGKKYTPIQPPFFMKKSVMAKTAQLEEFDEALYHVSASNDDETEGAEDKYLIATSEQPISAFHMNEWMDEKSLPIRYAGYSTCFRKEAGKHGKDAWGLFRIHQFEKVEQFIVCHPDESWDMLEEMIHTSQEFYEALELPYRVINIVSGELNNAASKKYDLEAWFPTTGTFRELVSCSNCTDYQSRNLEVRLGTKKKGEHAKQYVHMLNGTMCATERTLCCIVENYFVEDYKENEDDEPQRGLIVPTVLQPYMGGIKFLPATAELDKKELKNIANREKKRAESKKAQAEGSSSNSN